MSSELKAQLAFNADATGVEVGVGRAKKSIATLGTAAAAAAKETAAGFEKIGAGGDKASDKVDATTRNMIGSIQRQIAVMEAGSRSGAEYYRVLASQRGVDANVLKPYLDQLDAVAAKQKAAAAAQRGSQASLENVGMSARATAAAMRGVPAQFTDIVTSLQGGQAPLTVLLQQGGQLKDMFGGLGPAARALGTYVAGLISPLTLAAAAVVALGVAFYQGSQRTLEFEKSLTLSGNAVGRTAGQLDDIARAAGGVANSQGLATDAVNALVRSGQISGGVLADVAVGTVAFSKLTGEAVEKAAGTFVKLADEPTKASAKLNESLNYLNLSTYQRIRVLEEQGQKEQAAAIAQDALARESIARMQQVAAQAGLLSKVFSGVSNVASGMWRVIANGAGSIGAQTSASDALKDAQRVGEYLRQNGGSADAIRKNQQDVLEASRRLLNEENAALAQGQRAADNAAKIAADQRLADQKKATQTNAERRAVEIAQLKRDAALVGITNEDLQKRIADINEKYKDPKAAKGTERGDARAEALYDVEGIKSRAAAMTATYANTERVLEAQRAAGLVSEGAYYDEKKRLLELNTKAQVDALNAESERLNREKLNTKDSFDRDRKVLDNQTKIAKLQADAAAAQTVLETQQTSAIRAREAAMLSATQSARDYFETTQRGYARQLEGVGAGPARRDYLAGVGQIEDRYGAQRRDLDNNRALLELEGKFTDEARKQYDQRLAIITDFQSKSLAQWDEHFAKLRTKEADWSVGFSEGLRTYYDEAQDKSKQTADATAKSLRGLEDQLTTLMTGGKVDFSSFARSVIADYARIEARALIASLAGKGNGSGGLIKAAFGLAAGAFGGSAQAAFSQTGLGSSGFGSGLAYGNMDLGLSFDGGGSTGDGARSGGIDGKGGFMAMLHPRETVVDHTKGQGVGSFSAPVIINQTTGRVDQVVSERLPDGRQQLTLKEVAAAFDDPNSVVSKGMRRNYKSERRR